MAPQQSSTLSGVLVVDSEKLRFLVLDDADFERRRYVADVREFFSGCEIDEASNKSEALEKVRAKTFHAALLDIMLDNNPDNTDGLDVLEYISTLGEGTRAVMLSGSARVEAPVRALRARIAVDYIMKKEKPASFEKPLYILALQKAIAEVHIPIFGSLGRLTSYLAAPEDPNIWEYTVMKLLGAQGMASLSGFLSEFLKPLLPLLPHKSAGAMVADKDRGTCYAAYWSKALGKAVWICLAAQEVDFYVPPEAGELAMPEHRKQKLKGAAWNLAKDRSQFFENIWDVGKLPKK